MPSDCDRSCKDFDGIFDPPGIRTEHDELAGDITGVTDLDRLPDDILTFLVVLAPYVELLGGDYMDDSSIGFDGRHADLGGRPGSGRQGRIPCGFGRARSGSDSRRSVKKAAPLIGARTPCPMTFDGRSTVL